MASTAEARSGREETMPRDSERMESMKAVRLAGIVLVSDEDVICERSWRYLVGRSAVEELSRLLRAEVTHGDAMLDSCLVVRLDEC